MVGLRAGLVDFGSIRSPVVGAKDIVNAHVNAARVIGQAWTIARSNITVGQPIGNTAVGIGYWCVIEVAANYHAHALPAVFCHELMDSICLWGTFPGIPADLAKQEHRLMAGRVTLHLAMNKFVETAFVLFVQSDSLEMIVD